MASPQRLVTLSGLFVTPWLRYSFYVTWTFDTWGYRLTPSLLSCATLKIDPFVEKARAQTDGTRSFPHAVDARNLRHSERKRFPYTEVSCLDGT